MAVVSHDRHFLDAATTDSLHISGAARRLTSHGMCYSAWAAKRAEQQLALERRRATREEKKKRLEGYAGHGFKYGGSSSQINMMQRKAAKLLSWRKRRGAKPPRARTSRKTPSSRRGPARKAPCEANSCAAGQGFVSVPERRRDALRERT